RTLHSCPTRRSSDLPEVTSLVGAQLRELVRAGSSSILTISTFGAYWAASGGMSALMRALNRVNEVRETRPFWKSKGISLLTTLRSEEHTSELQSREN